MNDAEVSIKFNNKITNQKDLDKYAETLTKINSVLSGMNTGVMKQLQNSATSISGIDSDIKDINARVGVTFNALAISKYATAIKKLGASFTSLAKQSMDYLENFNLFQVAFNGNYESAERFINKMSEMYGLDESWLTQTVGKFKQLTNAMNLTAETGEKVSTLLTQMSLDISSLYNVDIDKAASTLSSAMAGQTKPIRGVTGGDITQATLQATLDNMGIEAAVSNLSFAEKRLLIIISLTKQLNASIGDMGRTIESPANQLRIMNEQWERLTRAVGNVFLPILSKILPYLNAILMVLTEIISTIASLVGYNQDDFDYFSGTVGDAWDLDEGLKSAGASAKKLKQGLRGFDKLNVITTPTKASSGGGAGAGGINPKIMKAFNDAFDEYQQKLKDVNMKATRIRDKIMEWLGFTKHVDKKTKDVYFTLNKGLTKFKVIVTLIKGLVALKLVKGITGLVTGTSKLGKLLGTGGLYATLKKIIAAMKVLGAKDGLMYVFMDSKIGKGISTLITGFGKLATAIGVSSTALLAIIAAAAALVLVFIDLYKTNDTFREKVDKLAKTIKDTFKPVLDLVSTVIKNLITIGKSLIDNVIKPVINLIIKTLEPVLTAVIDVLQDIFDTLKPIIKQIVDTLKPIIEDITKFLTDKLFPMIKKILDIITKIIETLSPIIKPVLKTAFELLATPIQTIATVIGGISKVVKFLYENLVKPFLNFVQDKINTYIVPAIASIETIVKKVKDAVQKVVDWWNKLKLNKKTVTVNTSTGSSGLGHTGSGRHGATGGIFTPNGQKLDVRRFAEGGLPPVGQMFIAREKGPELVGKIGKHTAVINNDQIVASVASGVYDAVYKANINSKSSQPINPTFIVQVGSKEVAKEVIYDLQGLAKTNGKPIIIGG